MNGPPSPEAKRILDRVFRPSEAEPLSCDSTPLPTFAELAEAERKQAEQSKPSLDEFADLIAGTHPFQEQSKPLPTKDELKRHMRERELSKPSLAPLDERCTICGHLNCHHTIADMVAALESEQNNPEWMQRWKDAQERVSRPEAGDRIHRKREAILYPGGNKPEGAPDFEIVEYVLASAYERVKRELDENRRMKIYWHEEYWKMAAERDRYKKALEEIARHKDAVDSELETRWRYEQLAREALRISQDMKEEKL